MLVAVLFFMLGVLITDFLKRYRNGHHSREESETLITNLSGAAKKNRLRQGMKRMDDGNKKRRN